MADYIRTNREQLAQNVRTKSFNLTGCMLHRFGKNLDPRVAGIKSMLGTAISTRSRKEAAANKNSKWVMATYMDTRHCINCIRERFGWIPFPELQQLVLLNLGSNLGKRWGELFFLAIGSLEFKIEDDGDRVISFVIWWKKGVGPGMFPDSVSTTSAPETSFVAMMLVNSTSRSAPRIQRRPRKPRRTRRVRRPSRPMMEASQTVSLLPRRARRPTVETRQMMELSQAVMPTVELSQAMSMPPRRPRRVRKPRRRRRKTSGVPTRHMILVKKWAQRRRSKRYHMSLPVTNSERVNERGKRVGALDKEATWL